MTATATSTNDATIGLPAQLERPILILFGALASTLLLKIAGVQYLEIIEFLLILYLVIRIGRASFRIRMSGIVYRLTLHYAVLIALIGVSALLALGRPAYAETTGLYRLGYASASRLLELILDVAAMLVLTEVFRCSPAKCLFTMRVYFWVGTLSAILGSIAVLAHLAVFTGDRRAIGFFNEGGPFGLYLLSNIAVGWVLSRSANAQTRLAIALAMVPNAAALVLSASKAAFVALGFMILVQALLASGLRQRLTVFGALVVALVLILSFTNVSRGIELYRKGSADYVALSNLAPSDYNLVAGRVAGLYLVPRMIAVHPWSGVGLANYGLVRNAFEYRGASTWLSFPDSPGLGLVGLVAEIGIPLSLYLLYVLCIPVAVVRRSTAWTPLISLALIQPIVHLFGAQLNLTYPWITTAFALGLIGAGVTPDTLRSYHSQGLASVPC